MDIPMVFSMISFRLLGVFGAFFYHDAAVFSWHNTRSYSEYTQNWYAKRLGEFGFGASEDGTVWTKGLMHDLSLDYGWLWTDHFLRCNLYILTCFGSIMFKKCSKRFLRSNYVYVFKICVNHVNHQLISIFSCVPKKFGRPRSRYQEQPPEPSQSFGFTVCWWK